MTVYKYIRYTQNLTITITIFKISDMLVFRYRGKGSPDAVMAEICWRAKNLFKDPEFEKKRTQMEVEGKEQDAQDHDELSLLEDYEDSEDDNYEYSEEF